MSSQLGHYKEIYGPQILLWLNLAYFLPSIPILGLSSLADGYLEQKFGVAELCFVRLVIGLWGTSCTTLAFPFLPSDTPYYLLSTIIILGLFVGLSFSASYQLVSRFANKNIIALGVGMSGSGFLVLLLEFRMGSSPDKAEEIKLYFTLAAVVLCGLWATVSLLLRHWSAINACCDTRSECLLSQNESTAGPQSPITNGRTARKSLNRSPSLPPLLLYDALEPKLLDSYEPPSFERWLTPATSLTLTPQALPSEENTIEESNRVEEVGECEGKLLLYDAAIASAPALIGLAVQSTVALLIFPFFTFVNSSGLFGSSLPKVLFFTRIFAELVGRLLPRCVCFAPTSTLVCFLSAFIAFQTPLFFLYIILPDAMQSDVVAVLYVAILWLLFGVLNTVSNMLARLAPHRLKSSTAGMMAIISNLGHVVGLIMAVLVTKALFGTISPGES